MIKKIFFAIFILILSKNSFSSEEKNAHNVVQINYALSQLGADYRQSYFDNPKLASELTEEILNTQLAKNPANEFKATFFKVLDKNVRQAILDNNPCLVQIKGYWYTIDTIIGNNIIYLDMFFDTNAIKFRELNITYNKEMTFMVLEHAALAETNYKCNLL